MKKKKKNITGKGKLKENMIKRKKGKKENKKRNKKHTKKSRRQ